MPAITAAAALREVRAAVKTARGVGCSAGDILGAARRAGYRSVADAEELAFGALEAAQSDPYGKPEMVLRTKHKRFERLWDTACILFGPTGKRSTARAPAVGGGVNLDAEAAQVFATPLIVQGQGVHGHVVPPGAGGLGAPVSLEAQVRYRPCLTHTHTHACVT